MRRIDSSRPSGAHLPGAVPSSSDRPSHFGVPVRLLTRLAAFVAASALVAGCGAAVPPSAAATVDGTEVPRPLLESVVSASLDGIIPAAEEAQGELGDEERTQLVEEQQRQMLTLLVQDAVIASVVADAGVEVDETDSADVRAQIVEAVEGEERLEELLVQDGLSMTVFDEVLVPQQARVIALREELAAGEDLETRTVRHVLVESEEEANEVVAALEADADFAELAAERSTDPGSAQQGGMLPPAPRDSYVPAFEEAVWEAEIGELVGPVETEFGFHVLEVVEEDVTPAEELDAAQTDQLVSAQVNELLERAYTEADIQIDPAFGEWDPETRSVVSTEGVGETPPPTEGLDSGDGDVEIDEPEEQ